MANAVATLLQVSCGNSPVRCGYLGLLDCSHAHRFHVSQRRIWEYAELEEFQLPYVFATLMDFPPKRSYKKKDGTPARRCWFRCWFDASVQNYDDLWIHRTTPLIFWRAWYELPDGKRKPKVEDLIDSYGMELTSDFLTDKRTVLPFVEIKINAWLTRNFRVD